MSLSSNSSSSPKLPSRHGDTRQPDDPEPNLPPIDPDESGLQPPQPGEHEHEEREEPEV